MAEELVALERGEIIRRPMEKAICPECGQTISLTPNLIGGSINCTNPECCWAFRV